jgi:hypothetical protein
MAGRPGFAAEVRGARPHYAPPTSRASRSAWRDAGDAERVIIKSLRVLIAEHCADMHRVLGRGLPTTSRDEEEVSEPGG